MLTKRNIKKKNWGESYLELILPHIKTASEAWPNLHVKANSTLKRYFQQEPC